MEIEQTALWPEIENILADGEKYVTHYWKATIHITETINPDGEIGEYECLKLVSLDLVKNYEANAAPDYAIEVLVPLGLYVKQILPNRTTLEVSLKKERVFDSTPPSDLDTELETQRFKAILSDVPEQKLEGTEIDKHTQFELDLMDMLSIKFQLIDKSFEQLKTLTVGGNFRKVLVEDVVKGVLTKESEKVEVEGNPPIEAVDMVTPNNIEEQDHVVIPQGTKVTLLAKYLQTVAPGIYNTGLACFLDKKIWYIFPPYDTVSPRNKQGSLVLYKVPGKRFLGSNRTYRISGDTIYIVGTEYSKFVDDSQAKFANEGNGVMFADAGKILESDPEKSKDNKIVVDRGETNTEALSCKRDDGNDNIQASPNGITSNSYRELSALTARKGGAFTIVWEHANPALLFPGMLTKVFYLDGEEIKEKEGVLLAAHQNIRLLGQGILTDRHTTSIALVVFVNEPEEVLSGSTGI